MLEGIQMWAGRLSKVGEPAIGVTATLVGCHVGPCPVGKHLPRSARASCQHLFRTVSSIDFQLHYLSCQVVENFRWIHSQMQKITDGCFEVTNRLAQVEILVFNLDALLEGIQEQLR